MAVTTHTSLVAVNNFAADDDNNSSNLISLLMSWCVSLWVCGKNDFFFTLKNWYCGSGLTSSVYSFLHHWFITLRDELFRSA